MSERIDSLRRLMLAQRTRWQRLQVLEALGWVATGALAYFLAAIVLDNLTHLPMLGRLLAAAGFVAVVVWLGRHLLARWRQRYASEDEVALAIERRTGGVQNRLINTLQINREGDDASPEVAAALARENCRYLDERPLPGPTPARPVVLWLLASAALLAIAIGGWLWQPARFATSAKRILLPFASIDPVYRTVLVVEPGDVETQGEVTLTIRIKGERPEELAVLLAETDRRSSELVPVPAKGPVIYTLKNIEASLSYAVRGGDFTSPYYRIEVPTPARLAMVRATYHYPQYTKLPKKTIEGSGDLEAVAGTRADAEFLLDHPADEATLIVRGSKAGGDATKPADAKREQRTELKAAGEKTFEGQLAIEQTTEYAIETRQAGRPPHRSAWHTVRAIPDEPPRPELTGLPTSGEIPIDSAQPVAIKASDDFGLARIGLFARRGQGQEGAEKEPPKQASTPENGAAAGGPRDSADAEAGWVAVADAEAGGVKKLEQACELAAAAVGAVEGERLEIVARAIDNHPQRAGRWISGPTHVVLVAGDGAQLQIAYEQILRTEAEIAALAEKQQALHAKLDGLVRKLDGDPQADGNVPERVKELVAFATEQTAAQDALRVSAGKTAREMIAQAGNLRLSLGMLADTELARAIRVLESVATRDDAAGRRTALAEARATQQRTLQSLQQLQEQYLKFRQDWELAHMTPFLRMLADREAALADASVRRSEAGREIAATERETALRRQVKLAELCGLAEAAFSGLAERVADVEGLLADAFAETSAELSDNALVNPLKEAEAALEQANWSGAGSAQKLAAVRLDEIYTKLHEAQAEAARRVLAALEDRADSDLAAQAEIEKLKEGLSDDFLDEPAGLKLEDIIHMAEVTQAKKKPGEEDAKYVNDYLLADSELGILQQPDRGIRQEFETLKLANSPGKTPSFPGQSDRKGNRVKPHLQEKFEDLVGDLLEEEDEMQENYETYNLNAAFNINEPGEIGKQGGDLNSTAAAAATGNQKPPTTNVGGASRVGRQGARAHGAAVGNESINRRGRDKVQEGQEKVADQAGTVKETLSDDPQEETSTGIGGRKVESEEAHFSTSDAGEWNDEMADRMQAPKEKQAIVERQGGKIDAEVADKLRDHNSRQEQIIERMKSIRKELKNLFLPTDELDKLIEQAQAQLNSLNERPTAEVFRMQQQTLADLRGALQVFHQAHSGFQASVPRDQAVRGRVFDDPARSAPPGYEEAVKNYYHRLTMP